MVKRYRSKRDKAVGAQRAGSQGGPVSPRNQENDGCRIVPGGTDQVGGGEPPPAGHAL